MASGQDALGGPVQPVAELAAGVGTGAELAEALRTLRRRHARQSGEAELTYREIAAKTGWSLGIVGGYFAGQVLPPTDRFDVLAQLLGATPAEQGALATARDRVDERRRRPVPAARAGSAPAHLPADVAAFTGRAADLAELDRLTGAAEPAAVVISAVSGTAGVGKTALAVRWAHRVADRFPDGQLYVNLRGFHPALAPLSAAEAMRHVERLEQAPDRLGRVRHRPAGMESAQVHVQLAVREPVPHPVRPVDRERRLADARRSGDRADHHGGR
ncbi:MAG TPA: helix-turn-helix transcriptional regulator, partial [Mycobacteriales bacterium]|nr:helix-turn-helix transcriptional regulator [Mycobacteriales bacterium]